MDTRALARRSVEIISAGQAPSGAYVACPTFPPYRFCWLRDGSFVADAMSRVGEVRSAEGFFRWCSRVILARREREWLAARYTLDGEDDTSAWPLLQHDGYGLWLWALRGHLARHGGDDTPYAEAVEVTTAYLARVWREPCTDWWEERDGLHPVTLACIWAGLDAWEHPAAREVRAAIPKPTEARPDGSLLLLVPLELASHEVWDVVAPLVSPGGGVHRHADDVYYGGGEWILLTALLGWSYAHLGAVLDARGPLDWIVRHATPKGELPEQAQDHLLQPDSYDLWVDKWGYPPCPLLWSHAMFLTLANELGEV